MAKNFQPLSKNESVHEKDRGSKEEEKESEKSPAETRRWSCSVAGCEARYAHRRSLAFHLRSKHEIISSERQCELMSEVSETALAPFSPTALDSLSPVSDDAEAQDDQEERWRCLVSDCLKCYSSRSGLRSHLQRKHDTLVTSSAERKSILDTAKVFRSEILSRDELTEQADECDRSIDGLPPPTFPNDLVLSKMLLAPFKEHFRYHWFQNGTFKVCSRAEASFSISMPYFLAFSLLGPPHVNEASSKARFGRWCWRWKDPKSATDLLELIGGESALRFEILIDGQLAERVEVKRVVAYYSQRSRNLVVMIRSDCRAPSGLLSAAPSSCASHFFFSPSELFERAFLYFSRTPEEREARRQEAIRKGTEAADKFLAEIREEARRSSSNSKNE